MAKVILYNTCGCFVPAPEILPIVKEFQTDLENCGEYITPCVLKSLNKFTEAIIYMAGGWQEKTIVLSSDVPEIDTGLAKTDGTEYEIKKVMFMDNAVYQREMPGSEIVFNSDTGMLEVPGYTGSVINIEYRKKQS